MKLITDAQVKYAARIKFLRQFPEHGYAAQHP